MNSSRSVNPRPSFAPRALSLAIALLLGAPAFAANSGEAPKNFGLDVKITGESENDRDLGTAPGGTLNDIGIDLRPWAFGQWGDWSAYFMGQAVAATDTIETDTLQSDTDDGNNSRNDGREPDKSYLAAREFWVDYAGLTAYPGEHLRFGRQRLREDSGQWQDTNIEALNWSFETTLLNAHAGVAQRFSEYRTDLDELAPEDKDRTHVFGDISTQWAPHHRIGVRIHHADDSGHLRRPGEVDNLDKTYTGQLTWLGIEATGDAYNYRSSMPLNYWASATWLTGDRDNLTTTTVDDRRIATGKQSGDVNAFGVDLGLRWNIDEQWKAGVGYARGSGGGKDGEEQFQQTGLESNRSNFTGTRSRVHRFGEAFRGELSNLQAATLFGSWQLREDYDASLVYHKFWRVDDDSDIGTSGINAALQPGEKDIGQELDLVVTKYFARPAAGLDEPVRRRALGADPLPRRPVRRATPTGRAPTRPCTAPSSTSSGASEPREETGHARHFLSIPAAGSRACARWPRQCSARCCCTARRAAQPVEKPQPVPAQAGNEPGLTQGLKETGNYTVTTAPAEPLHLDPPKLPDLSATPPPRWKPRSCASRWPRQRAAHGPAAAAEGVHRWQQPPRRMGQAPAPDAPGDLHRRRLREPRPARRQASRQRAGTGRAGVFVARLPIVVSQGATLDIDKQVKELRLSQERGAFLVNDGMLFVRDSKVTGWSESKKEPAWFKTPNEFRPFLISWGGAEVYLSNSTFTSFGYNASKAYGISISQYSPGMDKQMKRPRPKGWVIDSTIVDSWYGFYCYEADDLVVKGNTYRDNIVYGIDPHDRSHRLIIADNTVHGPGRSTASSSRGKSTTASSSTTAATRTSFPGSSSTVTARATWWPTTRSIATIPTASPSTRAATTCSGATRSWPTAATASACATA